MANRTITVTIDCDNRTYASLANAIWYAVDVADAPFAVEASGVDRDQLSEVWREDDPPWP